MKAGMKWLGWYLEAFAVIVIGLIVLGVNGGETSPRVEQTQDSIRIARCDSLMAELRQREARLTSEIDEMNKTIDLYRNRVMLLEARIWALKEGK